MKLFEAASLGHDHHYAVSWVAVLRTWAEFIVTNIYRLNAQRLAEYYFGELNTQQSYVYK